MLFSLISQGLEHSNIYGAVMSPFYTSFYHPDLELALTTDDIKGVQAIYGKHGAVKVSDLGMRILATTWHHNKRGKTEHLLKVNFVFLVNKFN